MKTEQTEFWSGNFGKDYTDRNTATPDQWNAWYQTQFGITKDALNETFLGQLSRDIKILEVGCNIGQQLSALQRLGFTNLYGIELQTYAVEKAKACTKNINIIQGSGFDIPFKDNYFDLVFTNGVLIHIHPDNLPTIMKEMCRVSNNYIWGFEYFSDELKQVNYRGHDGFLWKMNYSQKFINTCSDLTTVKTEILPYQTPEHKGNADIMYLL
jgi:pseudaminic acid biosynthesis-associated methylase